MKKLLLILIAFVLSGMVHSQEVFERETYFGIKGGVNSSGILSDPIIYLDVFPGFTGGIVFKHISQKSLGIQAELLYSQSGWSENLDSTNVYKRRLDYIQLPIMSHFIIGQKNTRIVLNLGPYLSYLLTDSEDIELQDQEEAKDYYGKKVSNQLEFGMCFGVGVFQKTQVGSFQLEGRVYYGLSDKFNTSADLSLESSQTVIGELSLSYLIDYKGIRNLLTGTFQKEDENL